MPVAFVPYTAAPTHLGAFRGTPLPTGNGVLGVPFLDAYVTGYTFGARIYPGADTTQDPVTWTPVDISAHILQPGDGSMPAITITRGRLDEQQQTGAAQCVFTLRNDPAKGNGDYTQRRVTGKYYPYMRAGLPVDAFIATSTTTSVRFAGYVEELLPQWDETGNYAVVVVTAYGIWQPIGQGTTPLRSPVYRWISPTSPIAYWTLEDGVNATAAASEVAGVASMRVGGAGTVAFGVSGVGGTAAMVDTNGGGTLYGTIPTGSRTATQQWGVVVGFEVQDTTLTRSAYPLFVQTSTVAGILLFSYQGTAGTALEFNWQLPGGGASGGMVLSSATMFYNPATWTLGSFHTVAIYTFDAGGGQVGFGFIVDGVDMGTFWGAAYTGSPGILRRADVNPDANDFATMSFVFDPSVVSQAQAVGHVGVWQPYTMGTTLVARNAASGYAGETPSDRLSRVCDEENIPFALPTGPSSSARTMGAQPVDTLFNVLRECETVEGGVLEDGYNFGLALWTVESRYNQAAVFTPALTQLQPPFSPVENTQRVRNDVTVTLASGSSGHYAQPAGQPYAVTGPGGVRGRAFAQAMNLADPTQLNSRASWLVHLGTVDADRYGGLAVNLAARTGLIPSWLAVTNGDRWTTSSTYPTGGATPDVLVEGWTEGLGRLVYTVTANSGPTPPWTVGVLDSAALGKLDTAGCVLAGSGWDGVSGSFQVTTTSGPLWTTDAAQYPFDLNLAGQRVTVSACAGASNPQTFTVSVASVNGVTKTHPANEPLSLWQPLVLAL